MRVDKMGWKLKCIFLGGSGLVAACTWVKPITEAGQIGLVKPEVAEHCEKLGTTTVRVKSRVGPIHRGAEKVSQELITLAKNDAAVMGADIITALGPVEEGRQRFAIFKCSQ